VAGASLPLSFAPFHVWPLAPLAVAALFLLIDDRVPREAAARGFWFGFGAFAAGTYWLYISIHVFGEAPRWLAVVLMLALIGAMAAYAAAWGWVSARFDGLPAFVRFCIAWPAGWVLVEWLRGFLLTGFPWLSLGYGQIDGPLAAWAPLLGVYGLSWVTAVVGGAAATLVTGGWRQRWMALALVTVLAVVTVALREVQWAAPAGEEIRVSLVQGSVPQDRKWLRAQREPTMKLYHDLTFDLAAADLVIWPEAAVPAVSYMVPDYLEDLHAAAGEREMQLLLGILTYDFDTQQYTNTLLALGAATARYDKRHLVPFGEYFPVPDFIRSWMRLMSLPYADTAAGIEDQPPMRLGRIVLAPSICYEDAFGAEQLDFLPEAGLLVNVSNDAWFGDSIAPHQHVAVLVTRLGAPTLPRLLAELPRPDPPGWPRDVLDPAGEAIAQSPQFETHVLSGVVTMRDGATPFVRFGNVPVVTGGLLLLAIAMAGLRQGRRYRR